MPLYEYSCKECGNRFEELVSSMAADNPPCPVCGNKKTDKLLSTFAASTGSISAAPACGMKGGSCGGGGFT